MRNGYFAPHRLPPRRWAHAGDKKVVSSGRSDLPLGLPIPSLASCRRRVSARGRLGCTGNHRVSQRKSGMGGLTDPCHPDAAA